MLKISKKDSESRSPAYLVLDIGTEQVKALVCELEHGEIVIRGVGKADQKIGNMQSGAVMDIASVIECCKKALHEAQKAADRYPADLIMGISGELVKGVTVRTSYARRDPTAKIDLGELKNIIHKVQHRSFEETRSQLSYETGFHEIDIKLVNAAIVDVRIDGYRVANPIGFQGKDVQIAIFNSFAPLVHFGALQTIAAELELNLLGIVAESFALSQALKDDREPDQNCIFLDIGAGTTDIAVVRNGGLEGTRMFTIGGRTFTKRMCAALNISYQEAEDIKIAYSAGKLEKQSEKVIREAIASDVEIWLAGVTFCLSEFHAVDVLPAKINICGGACHLPEIKAALESAKWTETLPFPKQPSIFLMLPKHVTGLRDATQRLIDAQDTTVTALARLGNDYLGEDHLLSRLLKNVIRLLQI